MILIIILALIMLITILITNFAFKQSILAKRKSKEEAINILKKRNLYDNNLKEMINNNLFEEIILNSKEGYMIKGYLYEFNKESDKFVILVHGYTANHYIQMPFIEVFKEKGYNVMLIDNRGHGESGGEFATYGKYESEDLGLFIKYLKNRYSKNIILGLHGQSMGASTSLVYGCKNSDIDFIVADCGYSDGKEIMKFQLKDKNKVPMFPIYNLLNIKSKRKCKFTFNEISIINNLEKCDVPIMFVHGDKDITVPFTMSVDMYNRRNDKRDRLLIVKDAGHMVCYAKNKENYKKELYEFLEEAEKIV